MAIPLALLHGFSFAIHQVAGVVYMSEVSPPEYAGLTQGAYGSFSRGLGSILGSLIGGSLYQYIGGASLYRLSTILGLLAVGFLLLLPLATRLGKTLERQPSKLDKGA